MLRLIFIETKFRVLMNKALIIKYKKNILNQDELKHL